MKSHPPHSYVLVVDDSLEHGRLMADWIEEDLNISALTAESIESATEQLVAAKICLIVSDYHVADRKGTELLDIVQSFQVKVPFLLMSGDPTVAEIARERGVAFISKPIEGFIEKVNACLLGENPISMRS